MSRSKLDCFIGLLASLCIFGGLWLNVATAAKSVELVSIFGGSDCRSCGTLAPCTGTDGCVDDEEGGSTSWFRSGASGYFEYWTITGSTYIYLLNEVTCYSYENCALPGCAACVAGDSMTVPTECYTGEIDCPST